MRWSTKCVSAYEQMPPDCGALSKKRRTHSDSHRLSFSLSGGLAGGHAIDDRRRLRGSDGATDTAAGADGRLRERSGSIAARVRAVGGAQAAVGVPVIVDGRVWGLATVGSVEPTRMPADTEARISGFAELIGAAVVAGYRDEQKRQMLDDTAQRSLWIDALLEGRVVADCSLAEVASCLRLPKDGPFVVIAAETDNRGSEALPVIESKLRSLDVYSTWRLLPDWQVGIAAVICGQQLDRVVALVSRIAVAPVGVSARFTDLRETPQAMHFAKMSLLRRADKGSWVAVFDGTILATASTLAAPQVMVIIGRQSVGLFW